MAEKPTSSWPRRLRPLLWWPVCFGLWLLFVGECSRLIAVWGVAAGLIATVGAVAVARQGLFTAKGRWSWIGELGPAVLAVPVDFLVLVAALLVSVRTRQRVVGIFRRDQSAAGEDPVQAGRRAWVQTVATWSPNCYVIDIAPDTGRRLIHDVRPRRSSELPA